MGALLPRRSTSASRSSSLLHALCEASRRKVQRQQIVRPPEYIPAHPRGYVPTPLPRGQTAASAALRAAADRRYRGAPRGPARHPLTCVYVLPGDCPARELRSCCATAHLIPGTAYATQSTTAHCMWTLPRRTRATYALCRRELEGRTRPAYRCIRSATRH